ncbi:MAG: peptidoglycan-binding protein, partial [Pseudomonadota bacterium]
MCFNGTAFNGLVGFVMRSMLAATLMFAAATGAHAQTTAPQVPGTKPKTVQTVPI